MAGGGGRSGGLEPADAAACEVAVCHWLTGFATTTICDAMFRQPFSREMEFLWLHTSATLDHRQEAFIMVIKVSKKMTEIMKRVNCKYLKGFGQSLHWPSPKLKLGGYFLIKQQLAQISIELRG
jgi:hypothetical protein